MGDKLKQALNDLLQELRRLGSDNPELLSLQEKTARIIETGGHLPAVEELRDNARTFEVRHPSLTALINRISNALSGLGI